MNRPSFQFYTKDWRSNSKLRRCSPAARGVWVDILCALHDSDEYGIARYPLKELASEVGATLAHCRELVDKGVLKGADQGDVEAFIFVPRSGRKDGEPVTLLPEQAGPLWYSSRMVKDEYVRHIRGEGTRFGDDKGDPPKGAPKPPFGDGPASSSSSAPPGKEITDLTVGGARPKDKPLAAVPVTPKPPDCPHTLVLALWAEVLPALPQHDPDQWKGTRADHLRARWRETAVAKRWPDQQAGLVYLRRLFAFVGNSPFLTGRVTPRDPGRKPFFVTLAWLVKPENWAKTIEGEYHQDAA